MSKVVDCGDKLLQSWNHCHGAFYQVHGADLRWNFQEQKLVRYWCEELLGVPTLWAEATLEGAKLGILSSGLWLSLPGEIPVKSLDAFAAAVEGYAIEKGRSRIGIGGDEFHFLPGIPVEEPSGLALVEAFRRRGFKTADCGDFVGAPKNPRSTKYIEEALEAACSGGLSLRKVESDADYEHLAAFLSKEFPGRWTREWKIWASRKDTGRAFWNVLRDQSGTVLGFSRLAVRGTVMPLDSGWTPGALRLPLASGSGMRNTDSCLGPIGVAASERGRGLGKVLLGLSLHELSLHGAELTCIDWTNAYNYYIPLGFEVVRKYLSVWREF